jgi:uncharacterized protein YceH (UPF0502 family)
MQVTALRRYVSGFAGQSRPSPFAHTRFSDLLLAEEQAALIGSLLFSSSRTIFYGKCRKIKFKWY